MVPPNLSKSMDLSNLPNMTFWTICYDLVNFKTWCNREFVCSRTYLINRNSCKYSYYKPYVTTMEESRLRSSYHDDSHMVHLPYTYDVLAQYLVMRDSPSKPDVIDIHEPTSRFIGRVPFHAVRGKVAAIGIKP